MVCLIGIHFSYIYIINIFIKDINNNTIDDDYDDTYYESLDNYNGCIDYFDKENNITNITNSIVLKNKVYNKYTKKIFKESVNVLSGENRYNLSTND